MYPIFKQSAEILQDKDYSELFLSTNYRAVVLRVDPGPAVSVLPLNLLEIHIFRLLSRPSESGTLGVGPTNLCFNKPSMRFFFNVYFMYLFIYSVVPGLRCGRQAP